MVKEEGGNIEWYVGVCGGGCKGAREREGEGKEYTKTIVVHYES